jgi:hypothetical protein
LALADYRQYRSRLNPVPAPLLVPDPENIYRWRVQYECGCIEEQLATNDNVEWLQAGRDSLSWPQEDGLRWLHLRGGGVSF